MQYYQKNLQYYVKACFQRGVLSFSKKLIYKEKCGKSKSHKKPAARVFQVCISIVCNSFILEPSISISIRRFYGEHVKHGHLSKHLFERKRQNGG